jgi:sialic acid synthase SpsE
MTVDRYVGERKISAEGPPLVIWEVGINHGGDVGKALEYVARLAEAGAECVKFQTHVPDAEMVASHPWMETIARCSLTEAEEARVKGATEARGMVWLSTPFSVEAVERLERLDVAAYKIGGGGMAHRPLVEAVAKTGKQTIVSRALTTGQEFDEAEHALRQGGPQPITLWCLSQYPAPAQGSLFGLGYGGGTGWYDGVSDHTTGLLVPTCAAALGAWVIEKHVRLDEDTDCPDAAVSLPMSQAHGLLWAVWEAWESVQIPEGLDDPEVERVARFRPEHGWRRGA